jgi:membrane-associated phospholipid phosphatase
MKSRTPFLAAILVTLALGSSSAVASPGRNAVLAGDIVTVLLPIGAFSAAYFTDDVEGEKQWLRDTVISEVVNTTLRVAFNQTSWGERPNGGSYGFPSGHAGFVFSQAGFLQERYGWKYGAPALALATAVSYIRVREDKHHWRDVIAGGAISYGISMLTVTPVHATYIAPIVGPDWLGIRFERSF